MAERLVCVVVERVYCNGALTKAQLAVKLDRGLVCTDVVRNGYSGGDVAYFRDGSPEEIERCRQMLAGSAGTQSDTQSSSGAGTTSRNGGA